MNPVRRRARRDDEAARALALLDRETDPTAARARFRAGLAVPTAGWAPGHVQANLFAVPEEHARDLLLFAQRNPKACPLLDVTEPGVPCTVLAPGADLRTDLPRYQVWRNGRAAEQTGDVTALWRDDLVAFLIGSSFTFDAALTDAGVPVRHVEQGRNVPMYVTNRPCRRGGRIRGPLVVTMRPIPAGLVATAVRVSAAVPAAPGAPVHVGYPAGLGIANLAHPDYGDAVDVRPGELPVFWACGVTPQAALLRSGLRFAISHKPGHMFITDVSRHALETGT